MKHAAVTKKPAINTDAALAFATGETKAAPAIARQGKPEKAPTEAGKRVFFAPEGYQRLTINLKQDLHKRLKIMAIEQETNVGKILENLIENYLAEVGK